MVPSDQILNKILISWGEDQSSGNNPSGLISKDSIKDKLSNIYKIDVYKHIYEQLENLVPLLAGKNRMIRIRRNYGYIDEDFGYWLMDTEEAYQLYDEIKDELIYFSKNKDKFLRGLMDKIGFPEDFKYFDFDSWDDFIFIFATRNIFIDFTVHDKEYKDENYNYKGKLIDIPGGISDALFWDFRIFFQSIKREWLIDETSSCFTNEIVNVGEPKTVKLGNGDNINFSYGKPHGPYYGPYYELLNQNEGGCLMDMIKYVKTIK